MNRMMNLIAVLLLLAAVLFFIPTLKSFIKGEPPNMVFPVLCPTFLVLGMVFFAAARKSREGSRPPGA